MLFRLICFTRYLGAVEHSLALVVELLGPFFWLCYLTGPFAGEVESPASFEFRWGPLGVIGGWEGAYRSLLFTASKSVQKHNARLFCTRRRLARKVVRFSSSSCLALPPPITTARPAQTTTRMILFLTMISGQKLDGKGSFPCLSSA
ncbi:hypothetical protein BX666DRAFT_192352 [Dichotomocladium elegans]|nr:hypothetical protein BX666DRAFT_192352 [Dichotomocladium elegans]